MSTNATVTIYDEFAGDVAALMPRTITHCRACEEGGSRHADFCEFAPRSPKVMQDRFDECGVKLCSSCGDRGVAPFERTCWYCKTV